MSLKTYLKTAWNEPHRFFFFLTLLCGLCLAVFFLTTYEPRFGPTASTPTILVWAVIFGILGIVVGLLGFLISWIPPVYRLQTWLLRRRLFVLACVITLVALFYAEENWRGHHAWQKYKRGLEAKGETVDLAKLAPPPVPDDQNFAMAPIIVESISAPLTNSPGRVKNWYGNKIAELGHANLTNYLKMPVELIGRGLNFTNSNGDWRQVQKTNLKDWQEYYRHLATVTNFFPVAAQEQTPAEDVLLALSKYDSNIEALRVASERPHSRFPLGYSDENPAAILLPHIAVIKSSLITVRLRAIAELHSGQSAKAFDDVKLMFRLTDSIRTEPLLISQLVRMAMLQITIQPIWEGLAEHKWNDAQLSAIESELGKFDFLADYHFAIRGERAFGAGYIDYLNAHRNQVAEMETQDAAYSGDNVERFLGTAANKLIPDGWFGQNKIAICWMHTDYFLPMVDVESHSVSLSAQRRASQAIHNSLAKLTPYNWFVRLLIPALEKAVQKFVYAQEAVDLARVACALERYRLAHENYPETLDALAPEFLKTISHDIIGGQPLKYHRTDDGQFVLYSVGWNEKDDGGTVAFTKGKTPSVDIRNGDWVWKYPAE